MTSEYPEHFARYEAVTNLSSRALVTTSLESSDVIHRSSRGQWLED